MNYVLDSAEYTHIVYYCKLLVKAAEFDLCVGSRPTIIISVNFGKSLALGFSGTEAPSHQCDES